MVVCHICHSAQIVKPAPSLSLPSLQKLHIVISEVPYLPQVPTDLFLHMCMCTYPPDLPDLPDLLHVHTICTYVP